jgi:hypothetical protein
MPGPASWQPDPFGRFTHRYWDGRAWTDRVIDASGEWRTDEPVYGPTPTNPPPRADPHPTLDLISIPATAPTSALVAIGLGAFFVLLSYFVLDWYSVLGRIDFSFSDVRATITPASNISTLSDQFLSWGWYASFAVIVVAVAALLVPALRWLGALAGGAFALWQAWVVYDLSGAGASARYGAWMGVLGFAALGAGALLAYRPTTT